MRNIHSTLFDVIIAGAGPVGLFLACELRLAGLSVLVLEKADSTGSPLKRPPFGLRGLTVPSVESLDRRGLLEEITARAITADTAGAAHWARQQRRPGGHFAGIPFLHDQVDTARWPYRLPDAPDGVATDMAGIESVLMARASSLGAVIRLGCEFETVEQGGDAVTVHAGGDMFKAAWLVGCDGGRSAVREAAGIGFTGTDPELTGYSVQVELADPTMLRPGRHYTANGMYLYQPPGTIAMVDFDGGAFHRTEPTRAHVQAILRKITGIEPIVTALRLATTWTDRAYQATEYRSGRVLLAGDAAHIHSPLGGQGLSLGLGDAMNLGWKLAAVLRGEASPDLLDTYKRERHPVGAQILDWSRAQITLMRPGAGNRALGAILRDLIATRDGATYFAERGWGVGLRYDLGDDHPLVGRSMPDFELANGDRANAYLRTGRGLLLDFSASPSFRTLAGRWGDRVRYVDEACQERLGLRAAIIRPDGMIAWATADDVPDLDAAGGAMTRWFGRPTDLPSTGT